MLPHTLPPLQGPKTNSGQCRGSQTVPAGSEAAERGGGNNTPDPFSRRTSMRSLTCTTATSRPLCSPSKRPNTKTTKKKKPKPNNNNKSPNKTTGGCGKGGLFFFFPTRSSPPPPPPAGLHQPVCPPLHHHHHHQPPSLSPSPSRPPRPASPAPACPGCSPRLSPGQAAAAAAYLRVRRGWLLPSAASGGGRGGKSHSQLDPEQARQHLQPITLHWQRLLNEAPS